MLSTHAKPITFFKQKKSALSQRDQSGLQRGVCRSSEVEFFVIPAFITTFGLVLIGLILSFVLFLVYLFGLIFFFEPFLGGLRNGLRGLDGRLLHGGLGRTFLPLLVLGLGVYESPLVV